MDKLTKQDQQNLNILVDLYLGGRIDLKPHIQHYINKCNDTEEEIKALQLELKEVKDAIICSSTC